MELKPLDSLRIPDEQCNGFVRRGSIGSEISIVVENVDEASVTLQADITSKDSDFDVVNNDITVEGLTKEDLGLNSDEDDIYDGLIKDFRTKMDSLSFRRLDRNGIRAQAASFRAQRWTGGDIADAAEKAAARRAKKSLMMPAVKFEDLEGDECYRRDTGSSNARSRASSGASAASKSRRRFQGKSQFGRKKSVMGALMKRGRTVRKTLRAMHINEAESRESERGYGVPPTNEQRLRMFVLREIMDTETEYMKLLQFMVEVIAPSLQKLADDPNHSCRKETANQVLCNVKEIHSLHVSFQAALQDVLVPAPFHTHCIGKIFLEFKDRFQVYDEYCSNFSRAQKVCYELEKDPDFYQHIEEWKNGIESQSRRFLHLEGFIISPVQRLCKYPLFLKELKKYTPSHHKDRKDVIEAQTVMEGVTQSVNESERRQLMVQAITDMENLCDSWEESGFVSKQGFMTKRGGSVKSWYIRWFLLRGYQLAYYNEPTDMHPIGVLDLTSYKSLDPDTSCHVGRPFSFGIKMPERTYYLYTTSEEEKQEWLNILQWKFDCIDRSRRQAHRPFETVVFSSLSSFLHPQSKRFAPDERPGPARSYSGPGINVGPAILTPTDEEDEVFSADEASETNSPSKTHGGRSKSSSLAVKPHSDVTRNGKNERAQSYRQVTSTIQKSPSKSKRISGLFGGKKSGKSRSSM